MQEEKEKEEENEERGRRTNHLPLSSVVRFQLTVLYTKIFTNCIYTFTLFNTIRHVHTIGV